MRRWSLFQLRLTIRRVTAQSYSLWIRKITLMLLSWNVKCPVGILKVLLKEGDVLCFDDIVAKIKELPTLEGKIINKVISVCKLILVNPATSASGQRSFSTDRRLKTLGVFAQL